ncbi:hypothetical protein THAOC_20265 [Thalassiosira oceanica]|uniref:Uncharacterized protein n=1 Tax=Thalassiosira oceanica TaxID=159749 RepID=K0SEX7_THAOC|nr:hypothetical protein THAOC_20265 [Thalassiosira oceanica]|eukprot:EJK59501.1 hypothetical protein THAOC_20265 [Thalassiosira oceanica]
MSSAEMVATALTTQSNPKQDCPSRSLLASLAFWREIPRSPLTRLILPLQLRRRLGFRANTGPREGEAWPFRQAFRALRSPALMLTRGSSAAPRMYLARYDTYILVAHPAYSPLIALSFFGNT